MSKLLDNVKKLKDNVNLVATVTTTGELWVVKKMETTLELTNMDMDEAISIDVADLPDIEALIRGVIEYIENLP